jgi:hypothetical protein
MEAAKEDDLVFAIKSGVATVGIQRWCCWARSSFSSADWDRSILGGLRLLTVGGEFGRVEGGLGVVLRVTEGDREEVADLESGDWWVGA